MTDSVTKEKKCLLLCYRCIFVLPPLPSLSSHVNATYNCSCVLRCLKIPLCDCDITSGVALPRSSSSNCHQGYSFYGESRSRLLLVNVILDSLSLFLSPLFLFLCSSVSFYVQLCICDYLLETMVTPSTFVT